MLERCYQVGHMQVELALDIRNWLIAPRSDFKVIKLSAQAINGTI